MSGSRTTSIWQHLRQLSGQSIVYGLGLAGTHGIGFLLLPLVSRYLPPAEYGIAAVMTSVGGVLGMLFTLSIDAAALRHYHAYEEGEPRRRYLGALFVFLTSVDLLFLVVLLILARPLASALFGEPEYAQYLGIVALSTFFRVGSALPLAVLRAQEKPLLFNVYGVGSAIASRGVMVTLVIVWRHDALAYLLGVLLGNAGFYFAFVRLMLGQASFSRAGSRQSLARALSFSLPLVPHQLSHWALGVLDRIMLQRLLTFAAAGIYSAGYAVSMSMSLLVQGLNYAWAPFLFRLYAREGDEADRIASGLMTHYVTVITSLALLLSLLSPEIVRLMVAAPYRECRTAVPLLIAGYWAVGLYHLPVSYLFLRERTKVLPFLTAMAALTNVAVNLIWIPRIGIMAPAWAKLVAYALLAAAVTVYSQRRAPGPFQWWRLARICIAGASAGVVGEWVNRQGWPFGLAAVTRLGLLAGFVGLLLALRVYRPTDLLRVVSSLRGRAGQPRD